MASRSRKKTERSGLAAPVSERELLYYQGQPRCEIRWRKAKTGLHLFVTVVLVAAWDSELDEPIFVQGRQPEQVVFKGQVKWDGCCNLTFGEQGYYHLCGLDDLDFIPDLFYRLNQIRKKQIKSAL